jgi:ParB family transcriptional regulator, chromosome partitioning protein
MGSNHFGNKPLRNEQTPLDRIVVKPTHRAIVPEKVDEIAETMSNEKQGLINHIVISDRFGSESRVLVAGRHRLEAARKLGWRTIPAFIVGFTEAEEQRYEIIENLARAELTGEQASLQRAEYARLCGKDRGGVEVTSTSPIAGEASTAGGISQAARDTGVSRTQIRTDLAIASIPEPIRVEARAAGATQADLVEVAAAAPEKQVEVIAGLVKAKAEKRAAPKVKHQAKVKTALAPVIEVEPIVVTPIKPESDAAWVGDFTVNPPELDRNSPWTYQLPVKPSAAPDPTAAEIDAIAGWLAENLVDGAAKELPGVLAPLARVAVAVLIEALKPHGYEPIPIPDARLTPAPAFAVAA